ncbi:MAG: AtpZ/AtpI family protein [Thermoflexales bacterium]|nr:AtpZ/AtpI family protein [Thermoflexales bacterium]
MSERKGLGWREGAFLAEAAAQIGCLTVVVILLALGAGLWLDNRLGTRPWFTLGLVLASIPVSLYLVVRLALSAARRAYPPGEQGREAEKQGDGGAEE